MEQTNENKKFLSELLVLKTGLALISDEAEKIAAAEKDCEDKKQKLDSAEISNGHIRNAVSTDEKEVSEKTKGAVTKSSSAAIRNILKVLLIVGGIVLIISFPIKMINLLLELENGLAANISQEAVQAAIETDMILSLVGGIAAIIIGIVLAVKDHRRKGDVTYAIQELGSLKKSLKMRKKQLSDSELLVGGLRVDFENAKNKYDVVFAESSSVANLLYQTLVYNYNDTLRVQYWKHIDLIFDYIDAGVAENKKEALLLAIQQEQTDQIVGAVERANANMCAAIRSSVDLMRYDMANHLSTLSNQLEIQHREMVSKLDGLGRDISAVNSRMTEINNQSAMTNTLLAKNNQTTKKLADDMAYIVNYAKKQF